MEPGRSVRQLVAQPEVLLEPGAVQLEVVAGCFVVGVHPGEARGGRPAPRSGPVDNPHPGCPALGEPKGDRSPDDTRPDHGDPQRPLLPQRKSLTVTSSRCGARSTRTTRSRPATSVKSQSL